MAAITTQSINSSNGVLSINGQDVSAAIIRVSFPSTWMANDITALGSSGRRYHGGIDETKFTVEAMFNQVATTGWHTVVGAVHAAKSTVAFIFRPASAVQGNTSITGNCVVPTYEIIEQVGDFIKVRAEFFVDNGVTFGTVA